MGTEISLSDTFIKLAIALGLGLLIGLQRERTDSKIAGIRTFPLVTIFGLTAGLLSLHFGGWVLAASILGLMVIIIVPSISNQPKLHQDLGITTEVAILLMFVIGAYLVTGYKAVAVVMVGTTMVLLHLKRQMHTFARRMGEKDFKAIIQFVLISLVILPILPNRTYDTFQVLNPFKIWLMVVLIVGISFGGYVVYKFLGAKNASVISGFAGGLISSTATTVSYARRTREAPKTSSLAAVVIMIASSVVFLRVLVVIGVVAPHAFMSLAGPLTAMLAAAALISAGAWIFIRSESDAMPTQENPSELRPAIFFALLFAVVLLGVAIANRHFGQNGLYVVAALSGLTDMDAITLSSLEMLKSGQLYAGFTWRMILVASMANLFFKAAIVAFLGDRKFFFKITTLFSLTFTAGLLILRFWP